MDTEAATPFHAAATRAPAGVVPFALDTELVLPAQAIGLTLFAHGSGSGRRSPRNQFVARALNRARIATLLLDLVKPEESDVRATRVDIARLAKKLAATARWTRTQPILASLPIAFFGASTGAAAALIAAAELGPWVRAVVSRGGRPDLAHGALARVACPTLLIVGGDDDIVLDLNRDALARLRCEKSMVIVDGATHLFVESGTLERVARESTRWLEKHFAPAVPTVLPTESFDR